MAAKIYPLFMAGLEAHHAFAHRALPGRSGF
jgi:hypothetical protein